MASTGVRPRSAASPARTFQAWTARAAVPWAGRPPGWGATVEGGELLRGVAEGRGEGGRGRAGAGQGQAGAADRGGGVGAVVAAGPPGLQGGREPPAGLGQELGQAGGGGRQLADELAGVGGLPEPVPSGGGVVQGADRPGRGAGQGQGLARGASPGRLLPSLPRLPVAPGYPGPRR